MTTLPPTPFPRLAAAALAIAILSALTAIFGVGLMFAPVAIALAVFALRSMALSGLHRGRRMAQAALALGLITLLLAPVLLYASSKLVAHLAKSRQALAPATATAPATAPTTQLEIR